MILNTFAASAGFTNPSPSARSVVEYTTKQGNLPIEYLLFCQ